MNQGDFLTMRTYISRALALGAAALLLLLPSLGASHSEIRYNEQVAVLMYHHVDDIAQSSGTITTALFREQLTYLKNKGYRFITLQQFKDFMGGATVPPNAVLVTFDDGYESFYTNAYPILAELRIPAVNFVITHDMETQQALIPVMSREQIAAMTREADFIDAQCHTHQLHYKLEDGSAALTGRFAMEDGRREDEEEYKRRIIADTQACTAKLSELSPRPVDTYAYPFGINDELSREYVKEAGIRYAFTIFPGMATRQTNALRVPRINAGHQSITPEGLEQSILRRVEPAARGSREIPLTEALSQIGGQAALAAGGVRMQYEGREWNGQIGSRKLVHADGQKLSLRKPLLLKDGVPHIDPDDFQRAFGVQLTYDPAAQRFTVIPAPSLAR